MYYKMTYRNGKNIREHRAVMQEYLGRALTPSEIVHHVDGNMRNNAIDNLVLTTRSAHAKTHCDSLSRKRPVLQYTKSMRLIARWESAKAAASDLGIDGSNICTCCRGKIRSCHGFVWRYENA